MGISDIFEMIQAVCATRIMGRPINGARVCLEVVVLLQPGPALRSHQIRAQGGTRWISSRVQDYFIRNVILAFGCDILDKAALYTSGSVFH